MKACEEVLSRNRFKAQVLLGTSYHCKLEADPDSGGMSKAVLGTLAEPIAES